jgi:hypothetical protein
MKVLRITSKVDGFRRAGISHPAVPTDHPFERFTPSELAALRAEPRLKVEEIETAEPEEVAPPAPDESGDGTKEKRRARK